MGIVYCTGMLLTGGYMLFESRYKKVFTENTVASRRRNFIVNIILGGILIFLLSANRTGYDSISHQRFYNYINNYNVRIYDYTYVAFGNVIYWVKKIFPDITYFEFEALSCAVLGIVMKKRLNTYMLSFRILCFFYLLSGTVAMDGMQYKNFIAVLFLMIAISFLLEKENNIKNTAWYILFVIIATLFHFTFAIYLLLVLIRWWEYEKIEKLARIAAIVGALAYALLYVFPGLLPGIMNALSAVPIFNKLAIYADAFRGRRSLPPVFLYFLQLAFMWNCVKKSDELPEQLRRFTQVAWLVNLLMGILLPGLLYGNPAYRLFRNVYIMNFMVYSNRIVRLPRLSNRRLTYSFAVMIICLAILVYPNVLLNQGVDVMEAMLNGEFFWIR